MTVKELIAVLSKLWLARSSETIHILTLSRCCLHVPTFLHPVVKIAPAAVEGRRAVAEHILCICHTGPTVQAVHVALVLLLIINISST